MTATDWLTVTTVAQTAGALDGRACRTRATFFTEVARALAFPDYFGQNWDALNDCLLDACPVELTVEYAEELLIDEPADRFATLLDIAANAAPEGFSLTLATTPDHAAALRARVASALPSAG